MAGTRKLLQGHGLAKHLLYSQYRDPGEEPKLYLFGQLKRITKQWLGGFQESIYPMHVLGIWGGAMVHHPALRAPLHRRGILWVW